MDNDYEALISRVAAACKVPHLHVDIGYGSESADGRWSIGVKYKLAWAPGFFEARSSGATLAAAESGIVEKVQRAYAKGSGAPMVDDEGTAEAEASAVASGDAEPSVASLALVGSVAWRGRPVPHEALLSVITLQRAGLIDAADLTMDGRHVRLDRSATGEITATALEIGDPRPAYLARNTRSQPNAASAEGIVPPWLR